MKLLVYSNCAFDPTLGSGKVRLRLAEGLRARGHEVRLVDPAECAWGRPAWGGWRFRLALGARRHARRMCRENGYDLVELAGGEFGWLARGLRGRTSRPALVQRTDGCELLASRAGGSALARGPIAALHRHLDESAFRCVDACIGLSSADSNFLRDTGVQPASATWVMPPGLDDVFLDLPAPETRPARMVFLGSWIPRKAVDVLAAAAGRVLAELPAVEFDLLGTRATPEQVRAAFPAEVRSRVWVGPGLSPAEMVARLSGAGVFVLPSRYEGFGMATAEAMACGCAAIATPTGFGADLVDGREALIVPVDDVDALAGAMHRLLADAELRRRIARAGHARVQALRWDRSVEQLIGIYERVVASRAGRN